MAARNGRDLYLVDFDGTFADADVGNRFFRRFTSDAAEWARLIDEWKAERIDARECLARECDLARARETDAYAFTEEFSLVSGAREFVAAARANGHDVEIASDGLTFYIERLLARAGLDVPFSANELHFEGDRLRPTFGSSGPPVRLSDGTWADAGPSATAGCGHCGNCKGGRADAARRDGARRVVLIGDGYSDRCAAQRADVVYAKDDLLEWCERRGIAARAFATLAEVARAEGWS